VEKLRWHYEHRQAVARAQHRAGVPVIGYTSNTVPYELIRAAGCFPLLLSAPRDTTPQADVWMEPVFDWRIRELFDSALAGEWDWLSLLVIPRTSEHEYKLFLYLKEVQRQEPMRRLPALHLYDLLHSHTPRSRAYGLARTRELQARLESLTGKTISAAQLTAAARETNAARAAQRDLLRLRKGAHPRLKGNEALALIGAAYFMERTEYAQLAQQTAAELVERTPLTGPRLFIKGAPLDHTGLHQWLEANGAHVLGEDDWWGKRAAECDIRLSGDPLERVFSAYFHHAPSSRVYPPERADAWFYSEAVLGGIDGVIFYLPPDDDALGWDYPRQKQCLDAHHLPSLLVREDLRHATASAMLQMQLTNFLSQLK
jgi:benzoyl-CoA reductase/2-hydroxyglutaryl-CoA dehydratase subunit BcrC/BadD/HgdB